MEKSNSFVKGVKRFIVSFIWFLIAFIFSFLGLLAVCVGDMKEVLRDEDGIPIYLLGIGLPLLVAIITFLVPYLRKKGSLTLWCGLTCLFDALWWIYLLMQYQLN
ncbi:MAG: hypothetical protein IJ197_09475 [Bacteroidaceae bacterium]|nr:hypothetical protein [Bacteroidaceae bacterium]